MQKVRDLLLGLSMLVLALCVVVVVLFESDILPVGFWPGSNTFEFYATLTMELSTIILLPLAVRLLKFKRVFEDIRQGGLAAYKKWCLLRLAVFLTLLFSNLMLYYSFMSTSFGYLAIIVFLSLMFVFPTSGRCYNEYNLIVDEK